MAARKSAKKQRRSPQRASSQETVSFIFEATARILSERGREGLTTNLIAERAGVSIGAIYGYFPNKDAILLAMARRELDNLRDRVMAALEAGDGDPVRSAIRALIKGYGAGGKVRRTLMEFLFAHGGSEEMARPLSEVAELIVARMDAILPPGAAPSTPVGMYVLTRAVDAVIRTAQYDAAPFRTSPEFEDELVRLIVGYVSAKP